MHHLRSGARNRSRREPREGLMTNYGEEIPSPGRRGAAGRGGVRRRPDGVGPPTTLPPEDGPRGVGEGGGRGASGSERCLWLRRFDLRPGKPGRSGRAAAKPRARASGPGRAAHPPSSHPPPPAREGEPAWPPDTPHFPTPTPSLGWSCFCVGLL